MLPVFLSSEYGTYKTVTARFWPWLSGKDFNVVPFSRGSGGAKMPDSERERERERERDKRLRALRLPRAHILGYIVGA